MQLSKRNLLLTLILSLITLFVFIGCATDDNHTTAPIASPSESVAQQPQDTPYPALTDAQLQNGLIPGFQILKVDTRAYGPGDQNLDDQSSAFIHKTQGGSVSCRNNGVQIGPWQLWEDRTVTVSVPNPGYAVVDFYPHPYHFNGCITMWIDLTNVQLPPGRRWDEVAFFYQDEHGNLTRYWGRIDLNAHRYYAWPDHFSRYILGLPDE